MAKNSVYQALSTTIAMAVANYGYQYFQAMPSWHDAFERSWFQAVALLAAWLFWRTPNVK